MPGLSDLSRRDWNHAQEQSDSDSELAERVAAAIYNYDHAPDEEDWYDAKHRLENSKMEVKSAHTKLTWKRKSDNKRVSEKGRFRLWRAQLRSLMASNAAGTAWVTFVLFDENDTILAVKRMKPSTVWSLVEDSGGWNESGHDSWGLQQKLAISDVFDPDDI